MSEFLEQVRAVLEAKMEGGFDGSAKIDIAGEGTIVIDHAGVRLGDEETDVTLKADAETFQSIFSGDMNPTSAFMTGKLAVDGNMGTAMKLASVIG